MKTAFLFLLLGLVATPAFAAQRPHVYSTETMGTVGAVQVACADSLTGALLAEQALQAFHHVNDLMSNWSSESEVSRINREAVGEALVIDAEVAAVLAVAARVGRQSGGAFDITVEPLVRLWGFLGGEPRVPTERAIERLRANVGWNHLHLDVETATVRFDSPDVRIDLGGIAKGYAVDLAANTLRDGGCPSALVDLSGNMVAVGKPPGRSHWLVGVRDPRDRVPYFARLALRDGDAVATSGSYEQFIQADGQRFGHILDPRTGWPTRSLAAVTVVAPSAIEADAWATALFVLGPAEARRVALAHPELEVILIEPGEGGREAVWVESSLQDRLRWNPQAQGLLRELRF